MTRPDLEDLVDGPEQRPCDMAREDPGWWLEVHSMRTRCVTVTHCDMLCTRKGQCDDRQSYGIFGVCS